LDVDQDPSLIVVNHDDVVKLWRAGEQRIGRWFDDDQALVGGVCLGRSLSQLGDAFL